MAHDEDLLEPFQGEDCWDDSLEQEYEDRFYAPEMEVDYSYHDWDDEEEDGWDEGSPFEVVGVLLVEVD